jgi:hypothetical protein
MVVILCSMHEVTAELAHRCQRGNLPIAALLLNLQVNPDSAAGLAGCVAVTGFRRENDRR